MRFDIRGDYADKKTFVLLPCFRRACVEGAGCIWYTARSETCFCYPLDNRGGLGVGNSRGIFDLFASAVYHLA